MQRSVLSEKTNTVYNSIASTFNKDTDAMHTSVNAVFRGNRYVINIIVKDGILKVEAEEDKSGGGWWGGEFTKKYVEQITKKTGNYKPFKVFVDMLVSALQGQSDSVFVDLLTYGDLQMLKHRRLNSESFITTANNPSSMNLNANRGLNNQNNKRYLILTYAVEFDRVHYPLPLGYKLEPDRESLLRTIRRLRNTIDSKSSESGFINSADGSWGESAGDVGDHKLTLKLQEENIWLKENVKTLRLKLKEATSLIEQNIGSSTVQRQLKLNIASLKKRLASTQSEYVSREQHLLSELDAQKIEIERLHRLIKSRRNTRTTSTPRTGSSTSGRSKSNSNRSRNKTTPYNRSNKNNSHTNNISSNRRKRSGTPTSVRSSASSASNRSRSSSTSSRNRFNPTDYVAKKRLALKKKKLTASSSSRRSKLQGSSSGRRSRGRSRDSRDSAYDSSNTSVSGVSSVYSAKSGRSRCNIRGGDGTNGHDDPHRRNSRVNRERPRTSRMTNRVDISTAKASPATSMRSRSKQGRLGTSRGSPYPSGKKTNKPSVRKYQHDRKEKASIDHILPYLLNIRLS